MGKADPAIFEEALHQLNMQREEAIMVGNSLEQDIAGGWAVGIIFLWLKISEGQALKAMGSDRTITDLRECLDLNNW